MKKKKLMQMLAMTMGLVMTMAACGNTDSGNSQESSQPESAEGAGSSDTAESAEEEQPETEEGGEAEGGSDVEIEVFITGPWTSRAPAQDDPYEAYIEQKFGGDWSLTCATEGETELVTRFSSDAAPDLIAFGNVPQLDMLYNEGVLIDDWNV